MATYVTVRVASAVAFQWEVAFADKHSDAEQCSPCVDTSHLDAYYLELPTLIRFDVLPGERTKLHLDFGPELAIHLGTVEHLPIDHGANFKAGNFGGLVGVGFQFGAGPGRITIDVRFKRWLVPLKDADLANNMSHLTSGNQISLALGYAFP